MSVLRRAGRLGLWLVALGLRASGALAWRRRRSARRGEVRILALHRVGAPGADPAPLTIPHAAYRAMLAGLARRYRIASFAECLEAIEGGHTQPHVLLTFDDGYLDHAQNAWPPLRAAGFPAVFFPASAFLDGEPLWWELVAAPFGEGRGVTFGAAAEAEIERLKALPDWERRDHVRTLREQHGESATLSRPLAWEDVRRMAEEGAAFGCHGVHHAILPRCDDAALASEVQGSRAALEKALGREVELFAFPDAECDERSTAAVARGGFRFAFGDATGPFTRADALLRIPRIPIDGSVYSVAGRFSWSLFEAGMLGVLPGPGRPAR